MKRPQLTVLGDSMRAVFSMMAGKAGQAPGTLTSPAARPDTPVRVRLTRYNPQTLESREFDPATDVLAPLEGSITWLDVVGLHDAELVERIGERFDIHRLILEDVLNTGQRPRYEKEDDFTAIILKRLHVEPELDALSGSHVAILLGKSVIISFREFDDPLFDPILTRLQNPEGRLRQRDENYLFYALMDVVVDDAFKALDGVAEHLENLEAQMLDKSNPRHIEQVHGWQRNLLFARKLMRPMREVLLQIQNPDLIKLPKNIRIYMSDLADHSAEVIESMDLLHDLVKGLVDLYYNSAAERLNAIMKTLSIIATIFLPLTFIAGVFGMNFQNMPELQWEYGYPVALGFMLGIALIAAWFFKRKGWW